MSPDSRWIWNVRSPDRLNVVTAKVDGSPLSHGHGRHGSDHARIVFEKHAAASVIGRQSEKLSSRPKIKTDESLCLLKHKARLRLSMESDQAP